MGRDADNLLRHSIQVSPFYLIEIVILGNFVEKQKSIEKRANRYI